MTFWIWLWKGLFIAAVGLFAAMAVWVAVGGWADIRQLLHDLRQAHSRSEDEDG